jgi:hypothetical protein
MWGANSFIFKIKFKVGIESTIAYPAWGFRFWWSDVPLGCCRTHCFPSPQPLENKRQIRLIRNHPAPRTASLLHSSFSWIVNVQRWYAWSPQDRASQRQLIPRTVGSYTVGGTEQQWNWEKWAFCRLVPSPTLRRGQSRIPCCLFFSIVAFKLSLKPNHGVLPCWHFWPP